MKNAQKWVWLSLKCGAGSSELMNLIESMGTVGKIYESGFEDYMSAGVSERLACLLCEKDMEQASKVMYYCERYRIGILCYDDEKYPKSLKSLPNPPAVLYWSGNLPDLNRRLCISVVGTRKMSDYGMRAAYKIAYETAAAGAVIISGMALGIDGVAACAAVTAGGSTVAVLGCGIDIIYPKCHRKLEEIIRRHGAVITEFPPATEPHGYNFPIRNRIISGLGQGTVVIDADVGSGAMITAKNAILQGRDIYAVPANIDGENSSGTNALIRDGAVAVLCGRDIISNYSYIYHDSIDMARLTNAEKRSEFDPRAIRNMEIGVRKFVPGRFDNKNSSDFSDKISIGGERTEREIKARNSFDRRPNEEKNSSKSDGVSIDGHEKINNKNETGMSGRADENIHTSDNSSEIFDSLSEKQKKIFEEIPIDRAVTVDSLTKLGFTMGEVMASLTVLEIKGLISSLPGALYIRK